MFNAVRLRKRKTYVRPTVTDATGKIICNGQEASVAVSNHFVSQFTGGISEGFPAHAGPPRPLSTPLSPTEVESALKRLKNGCAAGPDNIPGELLKYAASIIVHPITTILSNIFTHPNTAPQLGNGTLIPLQKPGKPKGPLSSLRPIVLLTTLRKTFSLIVLR